MSPSIPSYRDSVHGFVGPLKFKTVGAILVVLLVAIASPAILAGLIGWALWPRRKPTADELAAIERAKLDHLNETLQQLNSMDQVGRRYILAKEAQNMPRTHAFTWQTASRTISNARPQPIPMPESLTVEFIDLDKSRAHISGPGLQSTRVHTLTLGHILEEYGYKVGDLSFALVNQIERKKK